MESNLLLQLALLHTQTTQRLTALSLDLSQAAGLSCVWVHCPPQSVQPLLLQGAVM